MVRLLLVDDLSEDPRWVLDWVYSYLSDQKSLVLIGLEKMFDPPVPMAD